MSGDWRKQTKDRKTYQCEICRNQILPGEVYIRYDCTPKCDAALGYHEAVLARSKGEC